MYMKENNLENPDSEGSKSSHEDSVGVKPSSKAPRFRIAALLAIFLGWAGAPSFYLGHTLDGLIYLGLTISSFFISPKIVGIVYILNLLQTLSFAYFGFYSFDDLVHVVQGKTHLIRKQDVVSLRRAAALGILGLVACISCVLVFANPAGATLPEDEGSNAQEMVQGEALSTEEKEEADKKYHERQDALDHENYKKIEALISSYNLVPKTADEEFIAKSNEGQKSQDSTGDTKTAQTDSSVKVHYLDVDQGDSIFIELSEGKCMLIDAGVKKKGSFICNYIKNLGYSNIDYLIATHPHADHIGGMAQVINSFTIGEIWMPKTKTNTKTYENLLNTIASKGLQVHTASEGKTILDAKGCAIKILSPAEGASFKDLNEYSVILWMKAGEVSYMFTGDAYSDAIARAGRKTGHIDVFKVGHHGSRTSTTEQVAKALSPDVSIISCGVSNKYGHPHDQALTSLSSSQIYSTAANGTITVTSDGHSYNVSCQRDGAVRAGS